ncbi:MAG: helix-turn-helix domain-containing protein [Burkholderiaceae bacterium]|nr:helix-turn-helix domain-containing protein [Burkholderiaceae bacterium]
MASGNKTVTTRPGQRADSSTDRVLSILDLFTEDQPLWTTDLLIERLGVARATMYRYLRALVETGFLTPDGGGAYSLGPRFIEMDRQIRLADPLLQVAPEVMERIRPALDGDQLLCRFYGLRVLSIYVDKTDPRIKSSFDRGRPFPLFLGAPSRIILANLRMQQLQRLFLHHPHEIASAGLGHNWLEFRENMRVVSKRGYAVASDIDKTLVGISAPIFLPSGDVTASLCLVKLRKEVGEADLPPLGEMAKRAAAEITSRLHKPLRAVASRAPKSLATARPKRNSPRRASDTAAARRAAARRAST